MKYFYVFLQYFIIQKDLYCNAYEIHQEFFFNYNYEECRLDSMSLKIFCLLLFLTLIRELYWKFLP
jgi:hypothetical protein